MAHRVAGGDDHSPIRYSGGRLSSPFKRRPYNAGDENENSRYKRPKHTQHYLQHVHHRAYEPVDDPLGPLPSHPHPHPHQYQQQYQQQYPQLQHAHPHTQVQAHTHSPVHFRAQARSQSHPRQSPEPAACELERTASGLSIRPDPTERCASTELLEDDEAAQRVRDHMAMFRRRFPDSKHERILRSIINPRANAEYPLDNDSLESIFSAANEMFFNGRLSQRVMWDWSHESSAQYDSKVIGTTALRRASTTTRGFETLIVLSSPILQDQKYSRRLLISTFLHELVHSYMFICCGFRARCYGGHTPGFKEIASLIDDWAGPDSALHLGEIEADLERFRISSGFADDDAEPPSSLDRPDDGGGGGGGEDDPNIYHSYYPCSGVTAERRHYLQDQQQQQQEYAIVPARAVRRARSTSSDPDYYRQPYSNAHAHAHVQPQHHQYYSDDDVAATTTTWWRHRAAVRAPYSASSASVLTATAATANFAAADDGDDGWGYP
ncbi:hypothetical protein B0T24DRAFT_587158 [Lasiosphaeria ovina]|uniref:SprT-like domain-containing protein n=1 Tax=Lasiosphaeria ovina TaxID=92902 RepID=A0AAE0TWS7_9PEZI|nr:hypothetical protein B0T24DRAFT_587158 [Lasiosphaeria ovina]